MLWLEGIDLFLNFALQKNLVFRMKKGKSIKTGKSTVAKTNCVEQ